MRGMLMKLKYYMRKALINSSLKIFVKLNYYWALNLFRNLSNIVMDTEELNVISNCIKQIIPCNCLIFGVGNDSILWSELNVDGRTVFLEDSDEWYKKIKKKYPTVIVVKCQYSTKIYQFNELLDNPKSLEMNLPAHITTEKWNIIIVDAPLGGDGPYTHNDARPGRMQSIFFSSKYQYLCNDIFVHDCDRTIEIKYCQKYLDRNHLDIINKKLWHYKYK